MPWSSIEGATINFAYESDIRSDCRTRHDMGVAGLNAGNPSHGQTLLAEHDFGGQPSGRDETTSLR